MINKAKFYVDSADQKVPPKKATLENVNKDLTYENALRLQRRFAIQQIVLQCLGEQNLDAIVYPTGVNPSRKLLAPVEPTGNGKGPYGMFTFLGQQGFPALTVPAGFTTQVYDQVPDPTATKPETYKWVGPTPAVLPVGIDFMGRPFSEPTLFKIAAAYEKATHHRRAPADFGPLH